MSIEGLISRSAARFWTAPVLWRFGFARDRYESARGLAHSKTLREGPYRRQWRSFGSARHSGCTLHGSSASPAGRKKIAHRFIGGYEQGGEASPARDERTLPSLTGLVPRPRPCPPMNRWAIFFRPAGLAQMRVRCNSPLPLSLDQPIEQRQRTGALQDAAAPNNVPWDWTLDFGLWTSNFEL